MASTDSSAASTDSDTVISDTESSLESSGLSIDSGPDASRDDAQLFTFCGANIDLKQVDLPTTDRFRHTVNETDRTYVELDYDITIVVGDEKISAHKELLKTHIPYFRGLFSHSFAESSSGMVSLASDYCEFEPAYIRSIIRSCYDGHLDVSADNVNGLLDAALYLSVDPLIDACSHFLFKRVRCEDALSLLGRFRSLGFRALVDRLWRFIDGNFVPISHTAGFKEMPAEELIGILQRHSLRVDSEQEVFESVDRWMAVDHERWMEGARLLNYVRLSSLPIRYIEKAIETVDWVKADPECAALLSEYKNPVRRRGRSDRYCKDTVALFCSADTDGRQNKLRVYNVLTNSYTEVEMPWYPEYHSQAVAIGTKVYFIGDSNDSSGVLDTKTNVWSEFAVMPGGLRERAAVGVIDGIIYVAGGGYGWDNATKSLTAIDTTAENPVWEQLAPMTYARRMAGSCVHQGKLYVFGGATDVVGEEQTAHAEFYDPETHEWHTIAPMARATYAHAAAAADDRILFVGGIAPWPEWLNIAEAYTPATNTWTRLPDLPKDTRSDIVVVAGGRLLSCDDFSMYGDLKVLDIATNQWKAPLELFRGVVLEEACLWWMPVPATIPLPLAAIEEHWDMYDTIHRP